MNPGPGSYNTNRQSEFEGKNKGFSLSGRHKETATTSPLGPGAYNLKGSFEEKKGFSLGSKLKEATNSTNVPGPGSYNTTPEFGGASPRFSLSGRTKDLRNSQVNVSVGPGSYESKSEFEKNKSKGFSFSGRTKEINKTVSNPGPGTYNISGSISEPKKGFSLSGKMKDPNPTMNNPGPGSYNTQISSDFGKLNPRSPTLKGRTKDTNPSVVVPGPGSYNLKGTFDEKKGFSLGSKLKEQTSPTNVPGPGSYTSKSVFDEKRKGFSLSGRAKDTAHSFTPGPGTYTLSSGLGNSSPRISISGRHKVVVENNSAVGPGTYNVNQITEFDTSKAKGFSFSGRTKIPKSSSMNTPGPGAYEQKSTLTSAAPVFGTGI